MSTGVNTVILQGEVCWPEMKYVSNGSPLFKAKLRIPLDDASGEDKETFIRITAWDEFAEALNSLSPRSRVRVSGKIQERAYTPPQGKKQNITDIVVDGLEVVEDTSGSNGFVLQGELVWPDLRRVGPSNTPLFKGKLKISSDDLKNPGRTRWAYIRITAWNDLAEQLGSLEGSTVKVSGHVQERAWVDKETNQKRTFTDAVVTNFVVVS